MKDFNNIATEDDVITNSKLEHLYNHDFGSGRFFQVVFSNDEETHIKLAPKTLMKIVYIREHEDIEGIEIIKMVSEIEKQRIKFSKFNFQQLKCFLEFINSIDLKCISDRRIVLADNFLDIVDEDTKRQIATLLSGIDGADVIRDLLEDGLITSQDIVNTGYRKKELQIFRKLLEEHYLQEYKNLNCNPNTKDEVAWQYFFNKNEWIFGYGLDYRYQGILQKEFHASDTNANGSESVIADFLLGDNNFTTFVELKLPTTELFGKEKNRSNAWRFSNKFIDSVSQILEQKASGQIKIENSKELINDKGDVINQHAYDLKTILIIRNWDEVNLSDESYNVKRIKRKTFELFRRDSKNIEIITYDELYERASFIVGKQ
ncbi:Shedu anti-phage system protein SduA domain-containing protein [Flavobacterium algoritolerans]|uniref:DUF4263 domain-containing protein n=1 Tax=Flavobacterium algoritolerans TaxID=3041254 RepID=A0ABT6VCU4_9FLAO|nr:Shedu anti-phage system protein SduA domain-containing protein [Flavobacterium algoritolerans]MDI5894802.1 DUF4263 domain-containing protein [Flavobacterium algoritolerans]